MHELYKEEALYYIRGIQADRLKEICKAEKEGRLVVLPVNVGDRVYSTQWLNKSIIEEEVLMIFRNPYNWFIKFKSGRVYEVNKFGISIFKTYGEAENALKGGTE